MTAGTSSMFRVTVQKTGTGSGSVVSYDDKIGCGNICGIEYADQSQVILSAIPSISDSMFGGWGSGCEETYQNLCRVKMDANKTITALFSRDPTKVRFQLTINLDGVGVVSSNPTEIDCGSVVPTGSICLGKFPLGTEVVLTASQRSGSPSVFSKWEGVCSIVSGNVCRVLMDADKTITATFRDPPLQTAHSVSVQVINAGTVKSNDQGIHCGYGVNSPLGCTRAYIYGNTLILYAFPTESATFLAWSGSCAETYQNMCRLYIDGPKTITATFQEIPQQKTMTVVSYGPGSVRSDKTGIVCGSDCVEEFAKGASVVLSATPQAGATFLGWNGACRGNGTCAVTLDKARFAYARFRLVNATLTVTKRGFGTVTTIPAGVVCGNVCSIPYPIDTVVTLYATPLAGQVFSGWEGTGACKGKEPRCTVQMSANQSVTAVFALAPAF